MGEELYKISYSTFDSTAGLWWSGCDDKGYVDPGLMIKVMVQHQVMMIHMVILIIVVLQFMVVQVIVVHVIVMLLFISDNMIQVIVIQVIEDNPIYSRDAAIYCSAGYDDPIYSRYCSLLWYVDIT